MSLLHKVVNTSLSFKGYANLGVCEKLTFDHFWSSLFVPLPPQALYLARDLLLLQDKLRLYIHA